MSDLHCTAGRLPCDDASVKVESIMDYPIPTIQLLHNKTSRLVSKELNHCDPLPTVIQNTSILDSI